MRVRLAMRDITDDVSAKYRGGDRERPIILRDPQFFCDAGEVSSDLIHQFKMPRPRMLPSV